MVVSRKRYLYIKACRFTETEMECGRIITVIHIAGI